LVFPPEALPWLREALKALLRRDLGVHFQTLVETLIRVEERFGWIEGAPRGITKNLRPDELTSWISAGRGKRSKNAYDAGIRDIAGYAARWTAWWDSLQPDWRAREDDKRWRVYSEYDVGMDWGSLASPGQNGGLSLVAGLYFWGTACLDVPGTTAAEKELWETALLDVVWVLE
ncbi:hypothetical protein C8R46DRAFT_848851, partial [Mycena filopes]